MMYVKRYFSFHQLCVLFVGDIDFVTILTTVCVSHNNSILINQSHEEGENLIT